MRRLAVLVAALGFCLLAAGAISPLAPSEPAEAQADWQTADPDDELGITADEGLTDEELEAVVDRSMVRVEEVRGIEFEERPPVEVLTREEFQQEYGGVSEELPAEQSAFENAKLQALFLVGSDEDATAAQAENLDTAVAGFYSPVTGEIVLVSGDEPQVNELTLAHELVHAYQDQEWNLASYDAQSQDGSNGELGLIEGDAVYVETLYQERCEQEWECVVPAGAEPGEGEQPDQPANLGLLLLDFQPYDSGPAFIEAIYEDGGWAAVNALYDDPPQTTEQVIFPEHYPNDEPREIEIEDSHSSEWDRIEPESGPDADSLGMAAITTMFVNPLYESSGQDWVIPADEWFTYESDPPPYGAFDYGHEYAAGWDGDRFHAYTGGEEVGYVWALAWDSPEDAATFASGFDELLGYWGGERVEDDTYVIDEGGYEGAYHVSVEDDVVTITHAPDTGSLTEISEDAQPGSSESIPESDESAEPADMEDDESDELPGFGAGVAVVALVIVAFLLVRRR